MKKCVLHHHHANQHPWDQKQNKVDTLIDNSISLHTDMPKYNPSDLKGLEVDFKNIDFSHIIHFTLKEKTTI